MATLQQLQDGLIQAGESGDTERQQIFSDAMREHPVFRENAQEQLNSGMYKYAEDRVTELSKDEQRSNMSKYMARSMGLGDEDVDVTQGMGTYGRLKLSFQPTEKDKVKHLEDTYGSENVRATEVGGKMKILYRDEQETGNQFRAVDEEGVSLADFFGDTAGTALPIAGAVGAAALTGGASIPLMAGAAALGGLTAGVGQDTAVRAASGEDLQLGESFKRRGIEAAIGVPLDLVTGVGGKFIARRIAGGGARSMVDEVDRALASVDKQLISMGSRELPKPEALRTGLGSQQASEIASARPSSKLAKDLQGVRDRMSEYKELVSGRGRASASVEDFNRITEEVGNTYRGLVEEVGKFDKNLAKELEDQASRKLTSMSAPKVSTESVGTKIRQLIAPGVEKIDETNRANWTNLSNIGSQTRVPIRDITRAIDRGTSGFQRTELPKANAILRDLNKVLKGKEGEPTGLFDQYDRPIIGKGLTGKESIDFNEFKEIIDTINDVVSRNKEAGFGLQERIATQILKEFTGDPKTQKLGLRGYLGIKNPELGQALGDTLDYYKNNLLATKRSAVGRTLREQLADPAISPSQVAKLAIQDPAYIKQALSIAKQAGDGGVSEKALRKELQDMYLNSIGLVGDVDPKTMNLKFNEDLVSSLWGDGTATSGARKVKEFNNLKNRLAQGKGKKVADLTIEDVNSYLTAFTIDEKTRIIKNINARSIAKENLSKQKNAVLVRKMQPKYDKQTGTWLEPEISGSSLANFSDSFVNADTTQVKKAMRIMEKNGDDVGIQSFRQSYIGNLIDNFKGGAQVDRFGNPLWNPKAMRDATKPGSKLRANMEAILGTDGTKEILDANRVLLEAAETTGKDIQDIFAPRYSLTSGGVQFYGVGNLIGGLRGRALAWAYGSKRGSQMMRFLTNKGTDEETEAALKKFLPELIGSTGGIKAAAIQGGFDPEFTQQIAPLLKEEPEQPPQAPQ